MTTTTPTPKMLVRAGLVIAVVAALVAAPTVLGDLSGSGNVNDIVQLSTTTGSLPQLTTTGSASDASGGPVTSGASAFTVTNAGSNVDTFIRYAWSATPYFGGVTTQTSLALRGDTHYVGDLLWFRQETLTGAAVATASEYYSPLLVKNSATIETATFTADGNACTGWTGTAANGFVATSAGTFTFKYYPVSSPADDTPATSDTFRFCLDTTNNQVYLGKTAVFADSTLVKIYSTNSAGGSLGTYQYEPRSSTQTEGNSYCLTGVTGSGTAATPDLAQCEKLAFDTAGATTGKMYVLFDPPAYFPSQNQGGLITYSLAGTQWNPYAATTTNSA